MQNNLSRLIKSELESFLLENSNQDNLVSESGYTRLLRSLAGGEPNINSVGIITAENPMANPTTPTENKLRNRVLARELSALGYGFYQIQGKYGNVERPFVVPNITVKDILRLGKKYEQEAIIYVEKKEDGMLARFINLAEDRPEVTSRVVLPSVENVEDFYSLYKGRKFVIPFFDEFFNNAQLVGGRIVK